MFPFVVGRAPLYCQDLHYWFQLRALIRGALRVSSHLVYYLAGRADMHRSL